MKKHWLILVLILVWLFGAYLRVWNIANYIIVDDLWRTWGAVHIPQIVEAIAQLDSLTWTPVYSSGTIVIYRSS